MPDDQRSNAELEPTDQGDREIELKIRAWELHTRRRRSMAYIAEELGVSKTTVHRWVHQGEELAAQVDYLNVIRGRRTGISIMDAVQEWMFDLRDNPEITIDQQVAAAAVVIKAEERRDRLGGFEAPRRVAVADDRERAPVTVPGHVLDAVNRYVAGEDPYDDDDEEGRR